MNALAYDAVRHILAAPAKLPDTLARISMFLYLIRHGETEFNASGRIQGQSDSRLSDVGREQCELVAKALERVALEAVFTSPLARAVESARCLAEPRGLELVVDQRLMEINAGIFQGLDWNQIEERYPAECRLWKSHDPDFRIPKGETRREVLIRARSALDAIRETAHRHVAVVAHGGWISSAIKSLLEVPAHLAPFELDNGSISRVSWGRHIKLLTLNETAHLGELRRKGGEL